MLSKQLLWRQRNVRTMGTSSLRAFLIGEELEPRWVPADFTWNPLSAASKVDGFWFWNTAANWKENVGGVWTQPAPAVPGAGDSVTFATATGQSSKACVVNAGVKVDDLTINGYGGAISLVGSFTVIGSLYMDGNPAPIMRGENPKTGAITNGPLNIGNPLVTSSSANFYWYEGSLENLSVNVQAGATLTAGPSLPGTRPNLQMTGTQLNISGTLVWKNLNITTGPASGIQINQGGLFTIAAMFRTWGTDPAFLKIVNQGTVTSVTSTTIDGSYSTSGTTNLNAGMLTLSGSAIQNGDSATFNLNSGSINLGSSGFAVGEK